MMLAITTSLAGTGAHPLVGNRVQADGVGLGAAIAESYVAGGDGGVSATTAAVRWGGERWVVATRLPFASYRIPGGRTTNIGNLRLDLAYRSNRGNRTDLAGLVGHLRMGQAYTWTNDAASIWPGRGIEAFVQRRQGDGTAWIARAAVGVHGTDGYAPFPDTYVQVSAAFAVDGDIGSSLGLTAEAAVTWWDPSPIDLAGWLRMHPAEGMRARLGLLAPIGTWAGLSPSGKAAGAREITLNADLAFSL